MANPGFGIGRAPCSGPPDDYAWPPRPHVARGSCYQHTRADEQHVAEYVQGTKVEDWRCPPGGTQVESCNPTPQSCTPDPDYHSGGIPPYARVSDSGNGCAGPTRCDPAWPDSPGGGNCPGPCASPCGNRVDEKKCNAWLGPLLTDTPFDWLSCAGGALEVGHNCFSPSGRYLDLSLCRKMGFKNIQVWKSHHGRYGYQSHDGPYGQIDLYRSGGGDGDSPCGCGDTDSCAPAVCNSTDIEFEQTSVDGIRFRTEKAVIEMTAYDGVSDTTISGTLQRQTTVGVHTGVLTVTGTDSGDDTGIQVAHDILFNLYASGSMFLGIIRGKTDGGGLMLNVITDVANANSGGCIYDQRITFSGSVVHFQAWLTGTLTPYADATYDAATGEFHSLHYGDDGMGGWIVTESVDLVMSNSHYVFTLHGKGPGSLGSFGVFDYTVTGDLLDAYTSSDVNTDWTVLRRYWDLSDDLLYPWRTDEFCAVAPVVHYHEVFGGQTPTLQDQFSDWGVGGGFNTIPYVDPNAAIYDGAVRGAPAQSGGHLSRGYFDWRHRTFRLCCDSDAMASYVYQRGAYAGTAAPYGRKVKIVAETNTTPVQITIAADIGWQTDDTVDCVAGEGGTGAAGRYSIIRIDGTHATLVGSSASGVYTKGGTLNAYAGTFDDPIDPTDLGIPRAATEWTENFNPDALAGNCLVCDPGCHILCDYIGIGPSQGYGSLTTPMPCDFSPGSMPAGAWKFYTTGAVLYGQEWAEIKVPRPSINFARPCEADRYALDQTTVRCIQEGSSAGSCDIDSATAINTNDLVWVCGFSGIASGLYQATKNSPTNYTLTPKPKAPRFTGEPFGCDQAGTGWIGKLRWPTAPAVVTPVQVTAATNSAPIQITAAAPGYWATGDMLTLAGVEGNTAANGTHTVTAIDELTFTLDGTTGNGTYTRGGTIVSPGAPDPKWNDDQGKGEFALAVWGMDLRDFLERQRVIDQYAATGDCSDALPASLTPIRYNQTLHGMPQAVKTLDVTQKCLPFTVCDPQVMAITSNAYDAEENPDGEQWNNAFVTSAISLGCDGRYGAMCHAAFVQSVIDPFYQAPAPMCVGCPPNVASGALLGPDDGSCLGDCPSACDDCFGIGERFFAHPPMVEARLTLPAGAPALPAGIHVGFLTLADLDTGGAVSGNVLVPPVGPGYPAPDASNLGIPFTNDTPWGLMIREMQCACTSGRFAQEYLANGAKVRCPAG